MSQRVERVAGEVQGGARRGAGARRDQGSARPRRRPHHRHARARLGRSAARPRAVHRAWPRRAALERVRHGLDHASGYFRQAIARRLRMKVAPAVTFEVDTGVRPGRARGAAPARDRLEPSQNREQRTSRTRTRRGWGRGRGRATGSEARSPTSCWSSTSQSGQPRSRGARDPARGGRPAGRARRDARPAGFRGVAGLPRRGDQAGAVSVGGRQGVRGHGALRRRDRHRRCPGDADRHARRLGRHRGLARRGAGAFPGPDPAGSAGLRRHQARRAGRSTSTPGPGRRWRWHRGRWSSMRWSWCPSVARPT